MRSDTNQALEIYGVRTVITNATTTQADLARRAMDDNPAESTPFEIIVHFGSFVLDTLEVFHVFFADQASLIKGLTAMTIGDPRG